VLADTTGVGGMPYDGGDVAVYASAGGPWSLVGSLTQAGMQIITVDSVPDYASVEFQYQLNSGCYFMNWLLDDQTGFYPRTNPLVVTAASLQSHRVTAQMKCGGEDPNYDPPPQPQDTTGCDPTAVICEQP
jgi:hypothetical protein